MGTFVNIGNQIKSIIEAGVPTNNYIYNYSEPNPAGYPAITIEAYDGKGIFLDTGRNRRSYIFRIMCYQERVKVGAETAENTLRALEDEIIALFDNRINLNLNNSVNFAFPMPGKWGYIQAPDVDVRSVEILLEAVDVV